jgi:DNA processing protein
MDTALQSRSGGRRHSTRSTYQPPIQFSVVSLNETLTASGRSLPQPKQLDMIRRESNPGASIWCAGDVDLFKLPAVSIVGTREVSDLGRSRARRLAKELAAAGVVIMSGLARGVDTAAHESAIASDGKTIAVIGTPIEEAYPSENSRLQETIYREHLLVSPFAPRQRVFPSNFPARNRVMAALSDATVIIEASDSSGTLHQAAECVKLGRWLFITRAVVDDERLEWPKKFLGNPWCKILTDTPEILEKLDL